MLHGGFAVDFQKGSAANNESCGSAEKCYRRARVLQAHPGCCRYNICDVPPEVRSSVHEVDHDGYRE